MTFIDEIVNSIKAELYDRAVSPLMGSFLISWSICNHKFLMVIFAKLDVADKFKIIEQQLYSSVFQAEFNNVALMLFVYPLVASLLYIYLYPLAAKPAFKYARNRQKELKEIKTKIEDETPLTLEESKAIRTQFSQLEDEYLKEIERKNREIERKNNEIERLTAEIQQSRTAPFFVDQDDDTKKLFDASKLSEKATTLLKVACEDKQGRITYNRYIGGTSIQVGKNDLVNTNDRKILSSWEDALKELIVHELVIQRGSEGQIYELTSKGYDVANNIEMTANEIINYIETEEEEEELLDEESTAIMKKIGARAQSQNDVIGSQANRIRAKHLINTLIEKGYIRVSNNNYLSNTKKGIAYLVENNLA